MVTRFLTTLLLAAAPMASFSAKAHQRVIVADFEDVGTWRLVQSSNQKPGFWFAGGSWMGTSLAPGFADDRVGELRFAFDAKADTTKPFRAAFRREKMARIRGFLDGIEFDANAQGLPTSLRFVLLDSAKKRHWTPAVRLSEDGWKRYRLDLNTGNWSGFSQVKFPAAIEQVILDAHSPCEGSVLMDDLAITGTFTRKDQLSISPVYSSLHHDPEKSVELRYRIRNALPSPLDIRLHLVIRSFSGDEILRKETNYRINPHGQTLAHFDLGKLPIGAWSAQLRAESSNGRIIVDYDDNFGVFIPNGSRINTRPMWFGVQDQTAWQGEGENSLHLDWMTQIGFDLNRPGMTAGRFLPDVPESMNAWRRMFAPFEKAGIDSCLLVGETPSELMDSRRDNRAPPTDNAAYGRYAAQLGTFLTEFPRIKYVEFWNEPDIGFFHGTLEEYWGMFKAFSQGLRSTAPGIKLTTGGATVLHPREKTGFSQSLYSQYGEIYDVAAFHAHGSISAYVERQEMVESWQVQGALNKPIGNTESGERSGYDARGFAEQAVTLVKKMAYSKSRPRSEFHLWFTLQDYWDMDPDVDDSFGLITSDNRPKPSLIAYNELIRQLANTDPVGIPSIGNPDITAYEFLRDDGHRVIVCWAAEGKSGGNLWLRTTPGQPLRKIDMFGAGDLLEAPTGAPIAIGKNPIYLVSTTPFVVLPPEERPIDIPAEALRLGDQAFTMAATLRNPSPQNIEQTVYLKNFDGQLAWKSPLIRLAAGEHKTINVQLPARTSGLEAEVEHYSIELVSARTETSLLALPILVRNCQAVPYAASGTEVTTSPIDLKTAQDVVELAFDPSIPAWKGPNDLSAKIQLSHDNSSVLFRIHVTDDKHLQKHPDAELWRGDSVQLAFYNPATSAHTLLDLALRNGESVVWCHKNATPNLIGRWSNDPIAQRIHREGAITVYEIQVPFTHLGITGSIPSGGLPVRFSFLVNEDDGQGRVRWMFWKGGLGKNQDISQLGYGILMPPQN